MPAITWMIRRERLMRLTPYLALPGLLVGGLAIVQFAASRSTVDIGGIGRPIGTFTHPNNLSFYLERVIWFVPVALLPVTRRIGRWQIVIVAVVLAAALATLSRGAAIALVAGGCVYFQDSVRQHWRRVLAIAAPLIVVAFGVAPLRPRATPSIPAKLFGGRRSA